MDFSEILKEQSTFTKTENGAYAKNTTGSCLLDLFSIIGSCRNRMDKEIIELFEKAYSEDKTGTIRCLFYARDIRGGLGERKVFRTLLKHIGNNSELCNNLKPNLALIPEYGRYDDFYSLIETPLESDVWKIIKEQLEIDKSYMETGEIEKISLLAKWLKKADSKNQETKRLGIYTANKLGMSVYEYKRLTKNLRRCIDVVEQKMSERQWDKIKYKNVPSRAMMNYRKAFARNDEDRFSEYIERVQQGKEKINSSTLYPYDIVEKILYRMENSKVLETQYENLPNYVNDTNAIVMADVSGSMYGRPMATSIGLALYFAERNKGAYHNLFMTFSSEPQFVEIKGETLSDKISNIEKADWGMSTNLYGALNEILNLSIKNQCKQEELPKALIIISDMEIDACTNQKERELLYDQVSREFSSAGYKVPNIIFWNVNSHNNTFLADKKAKGVQLVSGSSVSTFKHVLNGLDKTPVQAMYEVLNGERYQKICLKDTNNVL